MVHMHAHLPCDSRLGDDYVHAHADNLVYRVSGDVNGLQSHTFVLTGNVKQEILRLTLLGRDPHLPLDSIHVCW